MSVLRARLISMAVLVIASSTAVAVELNSTVESYNRAAAHSLPPQVAAALNKIARDDRRLLALTIYLRAGQSLESRWSWSQAEIEAYEKSAEYLALHAEIEAVARRFAIDNPGYTLYTNSRVRSIEQQIDSWNKVNSIGVAAADVQRAVVKELASGSYPSEPSAIAITRYREFLRNLHAAQPPTLAAPGMSLHGRARAFDFQIQRDGRTVAAADASTIKPIWDAQGWTQKLFQAVTSGSSKFVGPLAMPREPWHYEYRP